MVNYEEVKDFKLKDTELDFDAFYDLVREELVRLSETDEDLEKAFASDDGLGFEEKVINAADETYNSSTYFNKSTIKLAFNNILREAKSAWKQIEYELSLVIVEEFAGCLVAGTDWSGYEDNNGIPQKQDLIFIVEEEDEFGEIVPQIRTVSIWGSNPTRDWEGDLVGGHWYQVGMVETEGKGKNKGRFFKNIGTFDEIESAGLPTLDEMLENMALRTSQVIEADANDYKYLVLRGTIRNIAPVPVWDDDLTKPPYHLKDREGKPMYDDDGNKIMGYKKTIVGYENLVQTKNDGSGTIPVMYFRLFDPEQEDDEKEAFFEGRFHNQYHGFNVIDIDFDDFLEDAENDDPEELATLLGDHLAGTPTIGVYKVIDFQEDSRDDDLVWIRANGVYIKSA